MWAALLLLLAAYAHTTITTRNLHHNRPESVEDQAAVLRAMRDECDAKIRKERVGEGGNQEDEGGGGMEEDTGGGYEEDVGMLRWGGDEDAAYHSNKGTRGYYGYLEISKTPIKRHATENGKLMKDGEKSSPIKVNLIKKKGNGAKTEPQKVSRNEENVSKSKENEARVEGNVPKIKENENRLEENVAKISENMDQLKINENEIKNEETEALTIENNSIKENGASAIENRAWDGENGAKLEENETWVIENGASEESGRHLRGYYSRTKRSGQNITKLAWERENGAKHEENETWVIENGASEESGRHLRGYYSRTKRSGQNITKKAYKHCATAFDNVYCWPRTPSNTLVTIPCPTYVQGFHKGGVATRYCTKEGEWFRLENSNSSWTNYSQCSAIIENHPHHPNNTLATWVPVVRIVSHFGYGVSLVTLLVAFTVLACIKRLRCPRNTLHMHLFLSFICRALAALARGSEFPQDIQQIHMEGGTWGCRLFTGLWQYFILANYAWILMEGLYLHNLIFLALFTDNSAITLYIVLGWGLPLVLVTGWVIARGAAENTLCWFTNKKPWIFWTFIRGPVSVSILVSFALFLNIARELLLKLRSSTTPESRKYTYRRWARSTLVLVPLFGVHYASLLGFTYFIDKNPTMEIIWLFTDQFFASFQGFFVATLYCLLNAEVRSELHKIWHHWRSTQRSDRTNNFNSAFSQSKSYFSRGPNTGGRGRGCKGGRGGSRREEGSPETKEERANGSPAQATCLSVLEKSINEDNNLLNSFSMSLAVVEMQPIRDSTTALTTTITTTSFTNSITNKSPLQHHQSPSSHPLETELECELVRRPITGRTQGDSSHSFQDTVSMFHKEGSICPDSFSSASNPVTNPITGRTQGDSSHSFQDTVSMFHKEGSICPDSFSSGSNPGEDPLSKFQAKEGSIKKVSDLELKNFQDTKSSAGQEQNFSAFQSKEGSVCKGKEVSKCSVNCGQEDLLFQSSEDKERDLLSGCAPCTEICNVHPSSHVLTPTKVTPGTHTLANTSQSLANTPHSPGPHTLVNTPYSLANTPYNLVNTPHSPGPHTLAKTPYSPHTHTLPVTPLTLTNTSHSPGPHTLPIAPYTLPNTPYTLANTPQSPGPHTLLMRHTSTPHTRANTQHTLASTSHSLPNTPHTLASSPLTHYSTPKSPAVPVNFDTFQIPPPSTSQGQVAHSSSLRSPKLQLSTSQSPVPHLSISQSPIAHPGTSPKHTNSPISSGTSLGSPLVPAKHITGLHHTVSTPNQTLAHPGTSPKHTNSPISSGTSIGSPLVPAKHITGLHHTVSTPNQTLAHPGTSQHSPIHSNIPQTHTSISPHTQTYSSTSPRTLTHPNTHSHPPTHSGTSHCSPTHFNTSLKHHKSPQPHLTSPSLEHINPSHSPTQSISFPTQPHTSSQSPRHKNPPHSPTQCTSFPSQSHTTSPTQSISFPTQPHSTSQSPRHKNPPHSPTQSTSFPSQSQTTSPTQSISFPTQPHQTSPSQRHRGTNPHHPVPQTPISGHSPAVPIPECTTSEVTVGVGVASGVIMGSDEDLPPKSHILYHTGDSIDGSPLISRQPPFQPI